MLKRLAIDREETSNEIEETSNEIETWNALGAEKVNILQTIKSVKREVLLVIHVKMWVILRSKNKIYSVDKKRPEGIYYIDLSASESDSEFANNITPKTKGKKHS